MKHIFWVAATILGILLGPMACKPEPEVDTSKPTISNITASPNSFDAYDVRTVTLSATAASASGVKEYSWACTPALPSGAKIENIPDSTTCGATVTGLNAAGTYTFTLTVTGNNGVTKTETVSVTVRPDERKPKINPGSVIATPASLTLPGPITSVALSCDAANADGSTPTKSVSWEPKSWPIGTTSPTVSGTTASGIITAGTYVFEVTVTGTNDKTETAEVTVVAKLDAEVNFEAITAGVTIDFSPSDDLPAGVTYILRDNSTPQKVWNFNTPGFAPTPGFNGQITAGDHYSANGAVTFTQTFYLNGVEITGTDSKKIVNVTVGTFPSIRFSVINSDSGSVTLKWGQE